MSSKRYARLLLDPAVDLAMADSVATFKLRLVLCAARAALLAFALGWVTAALWAALALMVEVEANAFFVRRHLSRVRSSRRGRLAFLLRAIVAAFVWQAVPALLILSGDGRFLAAGLILCAGTLLYAAAVSFRAPIYALANAVPPLATLVATAALTIWRQGWRAGLVFVGGALLCCLLAAGAAKMNHQRERVLRRTKRKLAHEAETVRRLAFNDQLTGLPNRRQLMLHLDQALARAERNGEDVALLLIDLDRFKFVNDTYGHAAGDALLREVADRLQGACRDADVCSRLGGDEFVVLAPGCGAQDAALMARRILQALSEPVRLPAVTAHTGASIGISLYSEGAADRDLMRQADLALYRVKESGRNSFCFFEIEMDQKVRNRRGLEADLREALEAGEIEVVYQPLIENDRMTGVEALARWTDPIRGAVPPNVFIPLAEECGLIERLGMEVIRRAFADSWRWARLKVSINLSPVQLKLPGFLPQLQDLLEASGVPAERIEFELTESILLADDIQTQHTLAALRALGFSLALDDFGTGYSSLSYLRKFPIDRIKIDRSFIAGLPHDKVSEAVVRAVVRLGRSLGLSVVAEGVETEVQLQAVSQLGCRAVQGFLTGRPVAADALLEGGGTERLTIGELGS